MNLRRMSDHNRKVRPKMKCQVENCDNVAHARNLCNSHYYQRLRSEELAAKPKSVTLPQVKWLERPFADEAP
jgi:hypothetical protein